MMKITTLQILNHVGKMWRWGGTMNECIEYHKQGDRQWHTFCKTRTFLRLCIRPTTPHAHSSWFYIKRQNSLIIEITTAWTGTIPIDVREKGGGHSRMDNPEIDVREKGGHSRMDNPEIDVREKGGALKNGQSRDRR